MKRANMEDAEALAGLAIQMWPDNDQEKLTEEFRISRSFSICLSRSCLLSPCTVFTEKQGTGNRWVSDHPRLEKVALSMGKTLLDLRWPY